MDLTDVPVSPLHEKLGIELLEVSPERAVGIMPVEGNTQPWGVLHGGASALLAESLASIAATLHAAPDGVALGIDLNATHHRAARTGLVKGVAEAIRLGRTIASYEVVISDDTDSRICTARLTCFIKRD